jgi:hypothetical protein
MEIILAAARTTGLEKLDVSSMVVVSHSEGFVQEFASVMNPLKSCRSVRILEWEGD